LKGDARIDVRGSTPNVRSQLYRRAILSAGHLSAGHVPLHETDRHQRRRDEIAFLIMPDSNASEPEWQLERLTRRSGLICTEMANTVATLQTHLLCL